MNRWEQLRDQELAEDVRDCLRHDDRSARLDLAVDVRGGVAHVSGLVRSEDDRELVRRLIGRLRGIYAVWDMLRTTPDEPLRVIDVGCGNVKQQPWSVGIDRVCHPAVDLVADVEQGLPFAGESLDQVFAIHVLEHIRDVVGLMNEIHRVLKPRGLLHVLSPHWQHVIAVADPTHLHFFGPETFKWFCQPRPGVRAFRPLAVSASADTVFADLQPVKDDAAAPPDELLVRFFA